MGHYVGLDVAMRETHVCVIDENGETRWQGRCRSVPEAIVAVIRTHAPAVERIALETGPLATWHWHALKEARLPVVCLHARHAKAALSLQLNKTDTNDAHGLAQLVRSGWYREVAVKSLESHRLRAALTARARLVTVRTALYNQLRGTLKTFGVLLKPGRGTAFEAQVRTALRDHPALAPLLEPLLTVWCVTSQQKSELDRQVHRAVRQSRICRLLMTAPGVGAVSALAFVTGLDDPHRFRHSQRVGAYLGLTPRRYQSGEVDRNGRISKCGDAMVRTYLFEAAHVLLTRRRGPCALRDWGLRLVRRIGSHKAKVAVARKLAVILHRMWIDGSPFRSIPLVAAA
jgi:transposase